MEEKLMNLRQIEFVDEVARTRSFTQAAQNLYISQPALSAQIKALEEELGFQLFIRRKKKPVEITAGGSAFLVHAQKINTDLRQMYMTLGEYRSDRYGEIRVGLFLTFGYTSVGTIIRQFRQAYPNIRLHFKIGVSVELIDALQNDDLDVAIIMDSYPGYLPRENSLPHYLISQSELSVIMSAEHPLASRTSISLTDLDGEPTLMVSRNSPMHQTLFNNMRALDAKPVIIGESSQADAIEQIAENGIAMGFLSSECHKYFSDHHTVAVPIHPTISRDVYFVCRKESRNVRWSKTLRDFLLDRLQMERSGNAE